MKFKFIFDMFIKNIFYSSILFFLIFQNNISILKAAPMINNNQISVTEELRLNIPAKYKKVWLEAEKQIWEPWLANQEGFLGRQIFYNEEQQQALILVNWETRQLWKSISSEQVKKIQDIFERDINSTLNLSKYPFELIYEGEIYSQK